ncbi:MAG: c-type cytochrome [Akkermansiaceae bacterium]|nr:c-type cytochrome [Verrucomicrobiales bacterium]
MNPEKDPLLLDHDVDGIQELDNNLPTWWVWLFYGCIIYAGIYLFYYHVLGSGHIMAAEYEAEMKAGNALKTSAMTKFESSIAAMLPATETAVLADGRQTFMNLCAPCHRADGGGLVGPNLTDDYWVHGAKFSDNVSIIWNGVPAKGMITWKNSLRPDQIYAVASYIHTLRGNKLEKPGKVPENQLPVQTGPSAFE